MNDYFIFEFKIGGFISDVGVQDESNMSFSISDNPQGSGVSGWFNVLSFGPKSLNTKDDFSYCNWKISPSKDGTRLAILLTSRIICVTNTFEVVRDFTIPSSLSRNLQMRSIAWNESDRYIIAYGGQGCIAIRSYDESVSFEITQKAHDYCKYAKILSSSNEIGSNIFNMEVLGVFASAEVIIWSIEGHQNGDKSSFSWTAREKQKIAPHLHFTVEVAEKYDNYVLLLGSPNRNQNRLSEAFFSIVDLTGRGDVVSVAVPRGTARIPSLPSAPQTPIPASSFSLDIISQSVSALPFMGQQSVSSPLPIIQMLLLEDTVLHCALKDGNATEKEALVLLLHADGAITALLLTLSSNRNAVQSARVLVDRIRLPRTDDAKTELAKLHQLSRHVVCAVSTNGDVTLFEISVETDDNRSYVTNIRFTPAAVDSLPPSLGPSDSCCQRCTLGGERNDQEGGLQSTSEAEGARVFVLRAVDSWTVQVFSMTCISPQRALQSKIGEGLYTAARTLATRLGVDTSLVALAEWRRLCSDGTLSGEDVSRLFEELTDKQSIGAICMEFRCTHEKTDLWKLILQLGIQRLISSHSTTNPVSSRTDHGTRSDVVKVLSGRLGKLIIWEHMQSINPRVTAVRTFNEDGGDYLTDSVPGSIAFPVLPEFPFMSDWRPPNLHRFVVDTSLLDAAQAIASRGQLGLLRQFLTMFPSLLVPHLLDILSVVPPFGLFESRGDVLRDLALLLPLPTPVIETDEIQREVQVHEIEILVEGQRRPLIDHDVLPRQYSDCFIPVPGSDDSMNVSFSMGNLADWYIQQALRYDRLGLTTDALEICEHGLQRVLIGSTNSMQYPELDFLNELGLQLLHFCILLRKNILPYDADFLNWTRLLPSDRFKIVFAHVLSDKFDSSSMKQICDANGEEGDLSNIIPVIISTFIRPWFAGDNRIFQKMSLLSFSSLLAVFIDKYQGKEGSGTSSALALSKPGNWPSEQLEWECLIVSTLCELSKSSHVQTFQKIVALAQASVPTLPSEKRCLQDVRSHVLLVLRCCRSFDDTAVGLSLMWTMLETTPTKLPNLAGEEKLLAAGLDSLQGALTACEHVNSYSIHPPISILLPDDAKSKMSRRRFVRNLLAGKGWMVENAERVLAESVEGVSSQDPFTGTNLSKGLIYDRVGLDQAIIIAMCCSTGEKVQERLRQLTYEAGGKKGKLQLSSELPSMDLWQKLIKDILGLAEAFFTGLDRAWTGCVILQSMLYFGVEYAGTEGLIMDESYRWVVQSCFGPLQKDSHNEISSRSGTSPGTATTSAKEGKKLSAEIHRLGISRVHVWRSALYKSVDILNSLSSSGDPRLSVAKVILSLLPPDPSQIPHEVSSTWRKSDISDTMPAQGMSLADIVLVTSERALQEIIEWLAYLEQQSSHDNNKSFHIVPLQLRLMKPEGLVSSALMAYPRGLGYFTDEGYDEEDANEGSEDSSKFLYHQSAVRPPRGAMKLVDLLGKFASARSLVYGHQQPFNPCKIWAAMVRVYTESKHFLFAYLLSRKLLSECAVGDSMSDVERRKCVDVVKDLMLCLESAVKVTGETDLREMHKALCSDLLVTSNAADISESLELWFSSHDHSIIGDDDDDEVAAHSTLESHRVGVDLELHLKIAKKRMVDVVGSILTRPGDPTTLFIPLPDVPELVSSVGANSCVSDVVGHLLIAGSVNGQAVSRLLSQIAADVERKISSVTLSSASSASDVSKQSSTQSCYLDEDLVTQLQAMGFSKNGARRSVLATTSTSFEAALRWAIQHGNDTDFDEPLTVLLSGALLQQGLQMRLEPRDLQRALLTVENVATALSQILPTAEKFEPHQLHNIEIANGKGVTQQMKPHQDLDGENRIESECNIERDPTDVVLSLGSSPTLSTVANLSLSPSPREHHNQEGTSVQEQEVRSNPPTLDNDNNNQESQLWGENSMVQPGKDLVPVRFKASDDVLNRIQTASLVTAMEIALSSAEELLGPLFPRLSGYVELSEANIVDFRSASRHFFDAKHEEDNLFRALHRWLCDILTKLAVHRSEASCRAACATLADALPEGVISVLIQLLREGDALQLHGMSEYPDILAGSKDGLMWCVTALRYISCILGIGNAGRSTTGPEEEDFDRISQQSSADKESLCISHLLQYPIRFLCFLSCVYDSCPPQNLGALSQIKKHSADALDSYLSSHQTNVGDLSRPLEMLGSLSGADVKSLQEESACLRRIMRIGPFDGATYGAIDPPNGKCLLLSDHLFPRLSPDIEQRQSKLLALKELKRLLRPSPPNQLQAWQRAVGRLLGLSLTDIQMMCAAHSFERIVRLHFHHRSASKPAHLPDSKRNVYIEVEDDGRTGGGLNSIKESFEADITLELRPQIMKLSVKHTAFFTTVLVKCLWDICLPELDEYFSSVEELDSVRSLPLDASVEAVPSEEFHTFLSMCIDVLKNKIESNSTSTGSKYNLRSNHRALPSRQPLNDSLVPSLGNSSEEFLIEALCSLQTHFQVADLLPDTIRPKYNEALRKVDDKSVMDSALNLSIAESASRQEAIKTVLRDSIWAGGVRGDISSIRFLQICTLLGWTESRFEELSGHNRLTVVESVIVSALYRFLAAGNDTEDQVTTPSQNETSNKTSPEETMSELIQFLKDVVSDEDRRSLVVSSLLAELCSFQSYHTYRRGWAPDVKLTLVEFLVRSTYESENSTAMLHLEEEMQPKLQIMRTRSVLHRYRLHFPSCVEPDVTLGVLEEASSVPAVSSLGAPLFILPGSGLISLFEYLFSIFSNHNTDASHTGMRCSFLQLIGSLLNIWLGGIGGRYNTIHTMFHYWAIHSYAIHDSTQAEESTEVPIWSRTLWQRLFEYILTDTSGYEDKGKDENGSVDFGTTLISVVALCLNGFRMSDLQSQDTNIHEVCELLWQIGSKLPKTTKYQLGLLIGGQFAHDVAQAIRSDLEKEDIKDFDGLCAHLLPCVLPVSQCLVAGGAAIQGLLREHIFVHSFQKWPIRRSTRAPFKMEGCSLEFDESMLRKALQLSQKNPSSGNVEDFSDSSSLAFTASPIFLAFRLVAEGSWLEASHVFWCSQGRPAALYTPQTALTAMYSTLFQEKNKNDAISKKNFIEECSDILGWDTVDFLQKKFKS